jgi:hypothetical protein
VTLDCAAADFFTFCTGCFFVRLPTSFESKLICEANEAFIESKMYTAGGKKINHGKFLLMFQSLRSSSVVHCLARQRAGGITLQMTVDARLQPVGAQKKQIETSFNSAELMVGRSYNVEKNQSHSCASCVIHFCAP